MNLQKKISSEKYFSFVVFLEFRTKALLHLSIFIVPWNTQRFYHWYKMCIQKGLALKKYEWKHISHVIKHIYFGAFLEVYCQNANLSNNNNSIHEMRFEYSWFFVQWEILIYSFLSCFIYFLILLMI